MRYIPNTPEGMRDRIFGECEERRNIQNKLVSLFRQRGYSEIITPDVEFYDVFTLAENSIPQEDMLKIIDKSGKICVLRPDMTTPIARVAATKLKDTILPRRFYYSQSVYRSSSGNKGKNSEIPQCGVELIGASGKKADLEMIAAAVDSIRAFGIENFHIEIGYAGIFSSFVQNLNVSEEEIENIRKLIGNKNFAALGDYLAQYSDNNEVKVLKKLAYLFGNADVLDEAENLLGHKDDSIEYLRELYAILQNAGYSKYIKFDLGMVHNIDYYTGVIFRGYVEGAGDAVLSGGRYDELCKSFGRPAEAIGFAVNIDNLAGCLPKVEIPKVNKVIHYEPKYFAQALEIIDSLPKGSCELSPCKRLEKTVKLAQEKNIKTVMILDDAGFREVEI